MSNSGTVFSFGCTRTRAGTGVSATGRGNRGAVVSRYDVPRFSFGPAADVHLLAGRIAVNLVAILPPGLTSLTVAIFPQSLLALVVSSC